MFPHLIYNCVRFSSNSVVAAFYRFDSKVNSTICYIYIYRGKREVVGEWRRSNQGANHSSNDDRLKRREKKTEIVLNNADMLDTEIFSRRFS